MFHFTKPDGWSKLDFSQKISIYGKNLNSIHANYVDKLKAKNIVLESGAPVRVAKVVKILDSPANLLETDLDPDHIIKSSHGCKWNIDIKPRISLTSCRKMIKHLMRPYRSVNEKQYHTIEPMFFIEQKIIDRILGKTGGAIVYMVRCIHGKPVSIGVKHREKSNHYDIDWKPLMPEQITIAISKPFDLEEMLESARILSQPFEFVRMDFYLAPDSIYFSEFTFTPNNGKPVFTAELEKSLAALW